MRGRGSGTGARERRLREANRRKGTARSDASGARVASPHRLPRRPAVRARRRARDASRGGGRRGGGVGIDSRGGGREKARLGSGKRGGNAAPGRSAGEEPGGGAARTPDAGGGDPPGHPRQAQLPHHRTHPLPRHPAARGPQVRPRPRRPIHRAAGLVDHPDHRRQAPIRERPSRGRSPPPGVEPRSDPGRRENPKLGLRRPREAEGPFMVSRANRAAAFSGRYRSSRSRRFSCRNPRSAGRSSRVRPPTLFRGRRPNPVPDRRRRRLELLRRRLRTAPAAHRLHHPPPELLPVPTGAPALPPGSFPKSGVSTESGQLHLPARAPKTPEVPCLPRSGTSV